MKTINHPANLLLFRKLEEKCGDRTVREIREALGLLKEAVYRRRKGEVSFSLTEAATLAREFNISLDKALENACGTSWELQLYGGQPDSGPSADSAVFFGDFCDEIGQLARSRSSRIYFCCTSLPIPFCLESEALLRYYVFKSANTERLPADRRQTFGETVIPEARVPRLRALYDDLQAIGSSTFILNRELFRNLAGDIVYFHRMGLISSDEVGLLQAGVLAMIARIEQVAAEGRYDNGNRASFYLSDFQFESSHILCESDSQEMCVLNATEIMSNVVGRGSAACDVVRRRIEALMRMSTFVSGSGTLFRMNYFARNAGIIRQLTDELYCY